MSTIDDIHIDSMSTASIGDLAVPHPYLMMCAPSSTIRFDLFSDFPVRRCRLCVIIDIRIPKPSRDFWKAECSCFLETLKRLSLFFEDAHRFLRLKV